MNANTGLITPKVFNWCQLVCAIKGNRLSLFGGYPNSFINQGLSIRGCTSGSGWADGGGLQVNLQHDPEDWDSTEFPLLWSLLILLILLMTVLTTRQKIRFLSWLWFQEYSEWISTLLWMFRHVWRLASSQSGADAFSLIPITVHFGLIGWERDFFKG